MYTFGNAERILSCCSVICDEDGKESELTEEKRENIKQAITSANGKTLRTLGVAYKMLSENNILNDDDIKIKKLKIKEEDIHDHLAKISEEVYEIEESGLTFVGLVGMKDPLRVGVVEAVRNLKKAGITIRMVTGDSKATAVAIAKEAGILPERDENCIVMLGDEFEKAVGGIKYLCPYCPQVKKDEKEEIIIDIPVSSRRFRSDKESKDEAEQEQGSPNKLTKAKDDKKMCLNCKEELQATAGDMEGFKKIADKLLVIATCRPSDKLLLVAALKFMYN